MEKGVKMFIYFSLIALITILSFSYLKYAGFLGYSSENEEIIPLSNGFCGDNECSFGENKINCPGDCDKISCDSWYDADGDGFGDLGECVGSNLYGCSGWIDNDLDGYADLDECFSGSDLYACIEGTDTNLDGYLNSNECVSASIICKDWSDSNQNNLVEFGECNPLFEVGDCKSWSDYNRNSFIDDGECEYITEMNMVIPS